MNVLVKHQARTLPAITIMASPTPLRRITRASMARFAYAGTDDTEPTTKHTTLDIEDIIPNEVTSITRKRKRTVKASPTTPRPLKTDIDEGKSTLVTTTTTNTTTTTSTTTTATPLSSTSSPRRARKPARKTHDPTTGIETVTPPSDWEALYDAAKQMRLPGGAASNAAVDTMGCERLADANATPRDQRFHTLVALMLSSQTKDTTNAAAMRRLQTELPAHAPGADRGLTLENMLAVDPGTLNELIWAVGFHNNKTRYLKQTAVLLRDRWGGDIPDSIEGLVSLPGVGPKMAHLCLSSAWGRTEGIGVDVHVHRITNLWGWHGAKTKTPEETRMALQSWLPRDKWREINWLLVGLGQTICAPVGRKCGDCDLGLRGLCKAADRAKVNQGRKLRELKLEVKEEGDDQKVVKVEETETVIGSLPVDEAGDDPLAARVKADDDLDDAARSTKRRGKRS